MDILNLAINIIRNESQALLECELTSGEVNQVKELLKNFYYKRIEEKTHQIIGPEI